MSSPRSIAAHRMDNFQVRQLAREASLRAAAGQSFPLTLQAAVADPTVIETHPEASPDENSVSAGKAPAPMGPLSTAGSAGMPAVTVMDETAEARSADSYVRNRGPTDAQAGLGPGVSGFGAKEVKADGAAATVPSQTAKELPNPTTLLTAGQAMQPAPVAGVVPSAITVEPKAPVNAKDDAAATNETAASIHSPVASIINLGPGGVAMPGPDGFRFGSWLGLGLATDVPAALADLTKNDARAILLGGAVLSQGAEPQKPATKSMAAQATIPARWGISTPAAAGPEVATTSAGDIEDADPNTPSDPELPVGESSGEASATGLSGPQNAASDDSGAMLFGGAAPSYPSGSDSPAFVQMHVAAATPPTADQAGGDTSLGAADEPNDVGPRGWSNVTTLTIVNSVAGQPIGIPPGAPNDVTGTAVAAMAEEASVDALATEDIGHLSALLIASLRSGAHDFRLQLRPAALGDISVRVVVSGQDVAAWFDAAQAHAQQVLGQGMGQLSADLTASGYNLTDAWVGGQDWTPRSSSGKAAPAVPSAPPATPPAIAPPTLTSPAAEAGISIYV